MTPDQIIIIYIVIFSLELIIEVSLEALNMSHARKNASSVPQFFQNYVDVETFDRSIEYTVAKGRFSIVSTVVTSLFLLLFILTNSFANLETIVLSLQSGPLTTGVLYIIFLSIIFSAVTLPFSLYSTFVLEEKFGFNKMTLKLWLIDFIKSTLLSAVIMVPIMYGLLWFMAAAGSLWWLYAFLFVFGIQLILLYVFPVWISPLFNKFTPMGDGDLKDAIYDLAKKAGFRTSGIFLMDGSKRSSHGNAYFTGFGRNKRIVLFDTLVSQLSTPQTVSVLAHEIGHEKKHHIKKSLAASFAMTLLGFFILSKLVNYEPLFVAFGFSRPTDYAALILFTFVSGPVTYFLSPLFSILSRKHEYEADRFAIDAVGGFKGLADALLTLSKKSLSNLVPHPLYSFFNYSHPTLYERISAMEKYSKT